eukprot:9211915-Pyramimonas_sp.AAC.1
MSSGVRLGGRAAVVSEGSSPPLARLRWSLPGPPPPPQTSSSSCLEVYTGTAVYTGDVVLRFTRLLFCMEALS